MVAKSTTKPKQAKQTAKARKPRTSQWGEPTRAHILEKLSIGKSLREICSVKGMPSEGTVRGWVIADEAFGTQYTQAREAGMEALADEILQIADSQEGDVLVKEDGTAIVNHDAIQRAKLRVDTRKWIMSKIAPKKYGDRLDLNHSGRIDTLPDNALDARLAQLLGKAGVVVAPGGEGETEASEPAGDV